MKPSAAWLPCRLTFEFPTTGLIPSPLCLHNARQFSSFRLLSSMAVFLNLFPANTFQWVEPTPGGVAAAKYHTSAMPTLGAQLQDAIATIHAALTPVPPSVCRHLLAAVNHIKSTCKIWLNLSNRDYLAVGRLLAGLRVVNTDLLAGFYDPAVPLPAVFTAFGFLSVINVIDNSKATCLICFPITKSVDAENHYLFGVYIPLKLNKTNHSLAPCAPAILSIIAHAETQATTSLL
eukprot:jgi/Psemu1/42020/gm1.42020_g